MPDAGFVLPPTARVVDASIAAINGGSIEFYSAGTTTPKTVYSDATLSTSLGSIVYLDSGGHTVASQGSSTKVTVYTGSATIKMVVKTSAGATSATYDNVQCAQDTSGFSSSSTGSGIAGVEAKTSDYSIVVGDDGHWFDCDPTGGSFTITLPSAATVGDGFALGIRHAGTTTTNAVNIVAVGGQTIARDGITTTADVLTGGGEALWLVSNGASWVAISHMPPRLPYQPVLVVDIMSTPPTSPAAGAWYLTSGTLTGAWASFTAGDLARANGQGGWIRYRPFTDCGWLAFVQDENVNYQYQNSAWVALSNITAPTQTTLQLIVAKDVKASTTAGGASTAGSWQKHVLNTSDTATITGGSVNTSNSQVTLPTGTYYVEFKFAVFNSGTVLGRIKSTTTATEIQGLQVNTDAGTSDYVIGAGYLSVSAATEIFELQYYCTASKATNGLGMPHSIGSTSEVYATVSFVKLEASQGPQGAQGPQGVIGTDGGISVWNWETSTSSGPASGAIRMNNATFASVTAIYIHETDQNGNGLASVLATLDDSTSAVNGVIKLHKNGFPQNYWYGTFTTVTDNGSDVTIAVTHLSSGGSFSATDDIVVEVFTTGDKGDQGVAGTTVPDISGLTVDTDPDIILDKFMTYDHSASAHKGVFLSTLARRRLSGNLTMYVRTDGNDSNTGFANTAGGALLTIQEAVDRAVSRYDLSGLYTITIQVGAGTYAAGASVSNAAVGQGAATQIVIIGNTTTPSNVVINTTGSAFSATGTGKFSVRGMKLVASLFGILCTTGNPIVYYENVEFGACLYHVFSSRGGYVEATGNWSISGNATDHIQASHFGSFRCGGAYTVTISANLAFTHFVYSYGPSEIVFTGGPATISLGAFTVTGQRYLAEANSLIHTLSGANYFPGNSAGSTATGGQYV